MRNPATSQPVWEPFLTDRDRLAMQEWPSSCGLEAWDALPRAGASRAAPDDGRKRIIPAEVSYEIMPQVAPRPGELVIRKRSSSAFWGTPLIGYLIANRIDGQALSTRT